MKNTIYLLSFFLLMACSKESVPRAAEAFNLVYPNNNESCLDATKINDTQSQVNFRWSASLYAESYTLNVTNLMTSASQNIQSTESSLSVTLSHSEPYSWKVTAQGEQGSDPISTEAWKFYLAGENVINYAPFPPELVTPRASATVMPDSDNQVKLSWVCNDVDNDLAGYKVYLDTTDGTTLVKEMNQDTTEFMADVVLNETYYWKVIAIDANGNTASSGVYAFRTQ
jgi:hypothetical protein